MTKKIHFKPLTIKIHPDLLDEIDRRIDGIRFRSRGHFIGCAVSDFIEAGAELKPKKAEPGVVDGFPPPDDSVDIC
jgi:metal-responsive CopG/Arc/MetJ family transcriptional regulator